MAIPNLTGGTVKLLTNDGTPSEVELGPGAGDFSIDGIEEGGFVAEPVWDRGTVIDWVHVQQAEVTWSITIHHKDDITDASTERPLDFVTKTGAVASGTSFADSAWTTKVQGEWTAGGVTHTFSLPNCRVKASYGDGSPTNPITITGTGYGTVTKTSA